MARKVPQAILDLQGREANLVLPVFLDPKVWLGQRGHQVFKACLVHKECRALKVFQANKARPDVTAGMGFLEGMESRARQEQRANKGPKESKASQARWGRLGKMAQRESQVRQVRKVIQVTQVRRVNRARRAKKAAQGHREREDHLESQGAMVREDHLEKEAAQAREDPREYTDRRSCQYIACLLIQDEQVASA